MHMINRKLSPRNHWKSRITIFFNPTRLSMRQLNEIERGWAISSNQMSASNYETHSMFNSSPLKIKELDIMMV
jgi:hypothetical protein